MNTKLFLVITLFTLGSITHAKDVFQCTINGAVVFQSKPCPQNIKTHEQVLHLTKEDLDAKKEAEALAKLEYAERLKQSAAQRGDLVVVPKHTQIAVDNLKPSSKPMAFQDCKKFIDDARLSTPKPFKTSLIANSKTDYLARICRKDGSIVLACSETQQKLIITQSAHCPL